MGGIKAVKEGKKVIMSPTSHCYFDYEIKSIDLEKVYSFNPIPKGLNPSEKKLIIGGECNLWSERIPNEKELDRKAFPRLLAISEVLWSRNKKDYKGFQNRVQDHYNILNKLKVNYEFNIELNYFSRFNIASYEISSILLYKSLFFRVFWVLTLIFLILK